MMASVGFLKIMVLVALGVTLLTPLILVGLWIKDWRRKQLW